MFKSTSQYEPVKDKLELDVLLVRRVSTNPSVGVLFYKTKGRRTDNCKYLIDVRHRLQVSVRQGLPENRRMD